MKSRIRSKVVVLRCESYDSEQVFNTLRKGLNLLGGIERFIDKTDKILVKPNLLSGGKPEQLISPHPSVFEGIIRMLTEDNYKIFYGDSPGFGNPEKVAEKAGLKKVADAYDIPLGEFTKSKTIHFPEGHICKQFEIAQAVLETDSIISLCKMKSHWLTRITGAVKNQLGCVYGLHKNALHGIFPDAISFSKMLVDLSMYLKPKLYIMDGIIAMEGNGPASGNPSPMNVILMSDDPVALDATFCRMINLKPEYIPYIVYGKEYGLGNWCTEEIDFLGDSLNSFINRDFDIPRIPVKNENITSRIWLLKLLRRLVLRKPVIDHEKCTKCGICVAKCPVEGRALNFNCDDKSRSPIYDYSKCIRCYCCQEMCPQKAIDVKTPLIGKIILYR